MKNLPHGFDKSADLLSKRQNHEEDFFKLCVLLKKSELYSSMLLWVNSRLSNQDLWDISANLNNCFWLSATHFCTNFNIVAYHMVHSLRDGHSKVWIGEFWMKENFWTQKSFIAYINFKIFLCNGIHATVFFYVFLWIGVEFIEFFCYIRTYIAVSEKKCNITGSSTTKWTKLN